MFTVAVNNITLSLTRVNQPSKQIGMFQEIAITTKRYRADGNLAVARHLANMTMRDISEKLGVSPAYYCRIETGAIAINEDMANKILKVLKKQCIGALPL